MAQPGHRKQIAFYSMIMATCLGAAVHGGKQADKKPIHYRVVDLATLSGCNVTYATSVNDTGWVVGYAFPHVPPGHGNGVLSRPFLWHDGILTELNKLGGEHGQALTITAAGDIGGYATTKSYQDQPVVWRMSRRHSPIRLAHRSGTITTLLDDGTAAGSIYDRHRKRAVLWKGGKMRLLGNPRDVADSANGVNRSGTVVGFFIPEGRSEESIMSPGDRHAAMWKDGRQIALPELNEGHTTTADGHLPLRSECRAINDNGIAVGWSDGPNSRSACVWKDEKVTALPTLERYNTEAEAINRDGVVVGQARERPDKTGWKWLACIWRGGKLEDLNRLIPADSGWELSVAAHISDKGLIVGYGSYNKYPDHYWRAFLLIPEPQ